VSESHKDVKQLYQPVSGVSKDINDSKDIKGINIIKVSRALIEEIQLLMDKFLLYDMIMNANVHDSFFIHYYIRIILIVALRCPQGYQEYQGCSKLPVLLDLLYLYMVEFNTFYLNRVTF
jgi:hypothetical protein